MMSHVMGLLHCADQDLKENGTKKSALYPGSKIRGTDLPIEYDLARLVRGIENPRKSWTTECPGCLWEGVKCDKNETVTDIRWTYNTLCGSLDLGYLPSQLKAFRAFHNKLSGDFPFDVLPKTLETLLIQENNFHGTFNSYDLPPLLEVLNIEKNRFSGYVDFFALPASLRFAYISGNEMLQGKLDVIDLPKDIFYDVNGTQIIVSNGPLSRCDIENLMNLGWGY